MLRLSREERQLIPPHFISFPIIFQTAAHMHKEPDVLSLARLSFRNARWHSKGETHAGSLPLD